MYELDFVKPAELREALALLADDPQARPLAGGQTFLPVLKQRLNRVSQLVDLSGLGLAGIREDGGRIEIGAMTTHAQVGASPQVRRAMPGLAKLAGWIGDTQVRNCGTIGGSLANNDPSACYPAAVLALGATIRTDRRALSPEDYFQGMFATALEPDELIVAVSFPVPRVSNYEKFRNPASRYAMAGVFVADGPMGIRVAVTGAGQGGVFRHAAMEAALQAAFCVGAIADVETSAEDMIGDIHGSAAYRAHLVSVMARRAVAGCL